MEKNHKEQTSQIQSHPQMDHEKQMWYINTKLQELKASASSTRRRASLASIKTPVKLLLFPPS